jgi:hypothetical protein
VLYTEALSIYGGACPDDPTRYASDIARVEAALEELKEKVPAKGKK